MILAWPFALLSLLAVPLLLGLYLWQLSRRRRSAVKYPNVALVRAALGKQSSWKRHLPVALLLGALTLLGFASSRPTMELKVPRDRTSIMVAIDVSRSMCAVDVPPNRFTVAKEALRSFIKEQDDDTRIGIIAFSGFAEVVAAPTTDRGSLLQTVDSLTTGRGTAIGAAILKSVDAIAANNPAVAPVGPDEAPEPTQQDPLEFPAPVPDVIPKPTTPPVSDIVVLLTDGANTRGVLPLDAAEIAAKRGVRVYPIGFGTTDPTRMVCSPDQLGADAFQDGGFGSGLGDQGDNMAQFLVVDEPTLKAVATATGGQYSPAADRGALTKVLHNLPRDMVLAKEKVELTPAFAAFGALLLLGAVAAAARQRAFP